MNKKDVADWYNRRYEEQGEQAFGRPPHEASDRLRKLNFLVANGLPLLYVGAGKDYFVSSVRRSIIV